MLPNTPQYQGEKTTKSAPVLTYHGEL